MPTSNNRFGTFIRQLDQQAFLHQIVDFQCWAKQHMSGSALDAVEKLCAKADSFALAFDYPQAYRTSNMIDRHMIPLDRCLFAARYFHGHWTSAEYQIRSLGFFFMTLCHIAPELKFETLSFRPFTN